MIRRWLTHPLMRDRDLDDPHTAQQHLRIIQSKPFLRKIYEEWYASEIASLENDVEPILEIGSGPGFLERFIPNLITSDILFHSNVSLVLDGQRLPFADQTLGSILLTNVLHHMPRSQDFLREAARCVRSSGVLVMQEPWVTAWSRFVYRRLHHEPFEPSYREWESISDGPRSGANSALPWIIFERDRARFENEFPAWRIRSIYLNTPFRYFLSGGLSIRFSMPSWSFQAWRWLEQASRPWMNSLAMFALIVLERTQFDFPAK